MTSTDREFDVILFGATGFVGELVAADLAAHAPAGTRIALAGRTRSKVVTVRQNLGANAAGYVSVDSEDTFPALFADQVGLSGSVRLPHLGEPGLQLANQGS